MQVPQKYLFDRDFDDLEILREIVEQEVEEPDQAQAEPEAPAEPIAPTFSEKDIATARRQGYDKGKKDGIAEALAGIEQATATSLETLATQLETIFATQINANEATERDAAHLALAIARKLFPQLYETHGLGEIVKVTEDILSHLIREPRLVLSVSETNVEPLRDRISDFLTKRGFQGTLEIRGESTLGAGDCKIEWMGGDAARDTSALFAEIDSVIERHIGNLSTGNPPSEQP